MSLLCKIFGITPTLAEYGAEVLALGRYNRKIGTNNQYDYIFRKEIVPVFGALSLNKITSQCVKKWQCALLDRGLSASSVIRFRAVLGLILNEAVNDEIIAKNPTKSIKPPKLIHKEKKPFSMKEVQLLLSKAEGWFKDFLTLSIFSGLRTGEAFALEWKNIDFKERIIRVEQTIGRGILDTPKTPSSVREVDMLPPVTAALKRQYERTVSLSPFVFVARHGGMRKVARSEKNMETAASKLQSGLPRDLHNAPYLCEHYVERK